MPMVDICINTDTSNETLGVHQFLGEYEGGRSWWNLPYRWDQGIFSRCFFRYYKYRFHFCKIFYLNMFRRHIWILHEWCLQCENRNGYQHLGQWCHQYLLHHHHHHHPDHHHQDYDQSITSIIKGKQAPEAASTLLLSKQLKNSREGRCVTRMFWGPFLVDRMMGS